MIHAIDFMKAIYPDGPWCLTAINPEQTGERTQTRTFYPKTEQEARDWVDSWDGKWNLYFTVNPVRQPMSKKADRTDLTSLSFLHVDIDPRVGEDLEAERARILGLFRERLPSSVPPPTVLVFSGGGYQAFWKLVPPLELDGTLEKAEEAKLWNMQLERLFNADSCHNIDRVMRLPFTMNMPNEKKRKKGRVAIRAEVIEIDLGRVYELSAFTPAPKLQSTKFFDDGQASGTVEVNVSGNRQQLVDVYELDRHTTNGPLPDRVKRIIQVGHDPEDVNGKPKEDRSVWVYDATCAMVRAGIPDDIILSALLDRDFRISDHVYDQKIGAEKYAIRQIRRAKEAAIDPQLEELNRVFAVVLKGGKTVVLNETEVELEEQTVPRIEYMSFDDFCKLYSNRFIQAGEDKHGTPKMKPLGKWWLEHQNRRQFLRGVHFKPLGDVPGKYNLWRGFSVAPEPGQLHEGFLAHLKDNVCSGNEEYYTYLIRWMAHAVQKPGEVAHVAVVLRGDPGTGKSFVPKMFGRLYGPHYITVSSAKHLVGNFNAHLEDKALLFADESVWHGDKASQSVLKTLITESVRMVEHKGFNAQMMPNYTRLIMASNDEQVVNAHHHERRFFVLTVSNKRRQETSYFKAIAKDLEAGGFSNLLHFLRTMDISEFDPRDFPKTDELQVQKSLSLEPHYEWWLNCLQDGKVHPKHDGWHEACPKEEAFDSYINYMSRLKVFHPMNKTKLLKTLKGIVPGIEVAPRVVDEMVPEGKWGPEWEPVYRKRKVNCYLFPPLEFCRKRFEDMHGEQEWEG